MIASVNQIMTLKYPGIDVTSDRDLKEQMRVQTMTRATMMFGYLRDIICRNRYVSSRSKIRIYKTCMRSVTTLLKQEQTPAKNNGSEDLEVTLRDRIQHSANEDNIRDIREISNVKRWTKIKRPCKQDDRLAKIAKMGNQTSPGHLDDLKLVQELDINITGDQARRIKYSSCKKKKKKKKKKRIFIKEERKRPVATAFGKWFSLCPFFGISSD